jgi:hypothetical protein
MSRKRREKQYRKSFHEQWELPCDSEHHIRPWSRSSDDRQENKVKVNEKLHEKFHSLFINRTPEEVIEFLLDYFFGGRVQILINVLKKKGVYR